VSYPILYGFFFTYESPSVARSRVNDSFRTHYEQKMIFFRSSI